MDEISKEQRELLKRRWDENGDCRSCGWHAGYFEVQEQLEECVLTDDTEEDGSIWIPCYSDDADEGSGHRGSNIYDWKI